MNLKRTLIAIINVVVEEAAQNAEFRVRLEEVLGENVKSVPTRRAPAQESTSEKRDLEKRRGGRRSEALLDPVALAVQSPADLRARLEDIDLDRLHDIVAQYGMDPGKLVMKWKDRARVIERIVEISVARATKGDAFRKVREDD
jgi:hypothetical protein